ncbi:MAG: SRPBCC family protein [Longimicrobiales bacterium]
MKTGAWIFGILSILFVIYLLVGLFLPGTWETEVEAVVPAPPSRTFPFLSDPGAWSQWSPMPEAGATTFGAPRGEGAGLRWDDPRYGRGELRILATRTDEMVEYRVEVEGGALRIHGTMTLDPVEGGTRIRWKESGDFGWNPLLGYAARRMGESQGLAMEESLETLSRILEGSLPDSLPVPPIDP